MSEDYKKFLGDVELPPARTPDLQKTVPTFCPKCEEIRGEDSVSLMSSHAKLMFVSFGMCVHCYIFNRDHPQEAAENVKKYQEKLKQKEAEIKEEVSARRFRIYLFEENEKITNSSYATSVTKIPFTKYPTETPKGLVNKSNQLLKKDEAEKIVWILESKGLKAWYEEEKADLVTG